jgi:signal transduction histidine kinase
MDKRDIDSPGHPQRAQTDQSLQVERERADARVGAKSNAVEEEADEVVRLARERADTLVRNARDDADRERRPHVTTPDASSTRERIRADVLLDDERSSADAVLEHERTQRRRYLADFLAVYREATDNHLDSEREHADGLIAVRDEFLATVSHDLRSLLGGLSLNAGLLIKQAPEGPTGDKMRWHGATNQRLVARMSRLVNDLLDVTSIEAGKLALLPEKVEIATLVRDTFDAFMPIAAVKRITMGVAAAPRGAVHDEGAFGPIRA